MSKVFRRISSGHDVAQAKLCKSERQSVRSGSSIKYTANCDGFISTFPGLFFFEYFFVVFHNFSLFVEFKRQLFYIFSLHNIERAEIFSVCLYAFKRIISWVDYISLYEQIIVENCVKKWGKRQIRTHQRTKPSN